jgi:hypothetical protein
VFEDLMGTSGLDVLYTTNGETQLFPGCWVTPNMFDFLGVLPVRCWFYVMNEQYSFCYLSR